MDWDDIVYLLLLFSSIACGKFYRQIEDVSQKQLVGSIVGLGIIIFVSGLHSLHVFILVLVNTCVVLWTSKKKCHLLSIIFSFSYLLFFRTTIYFGIPYPPGHTNLIIMIMTLKLVGLAFEVNLMYTKEKNINNFNEEDLGEFEATKIEPTFMDVMHYSLNYIGILTGPYFSYRTYWDFLHKPYSNNADCDKATWKEFKIIPILTVIFLYISYQWPLSYVFTDEFYEERSWLYRWWYTIPIFWMFRTRIYIGILLSSCVCTMAGLGAYPSFTAPKPGKGPSRNFAELKNMTDDDLKKQDYLFGTILNIDVYNVETCTTFRESIRYWNTTVQYWMAINIYKRFPEKKFRTLVTMIVSAFWHGMYIGHYFTISGAPFYMVIEDMWVKLFLKDNKGSSTKIWGWIIYLSKWVAFSYLGMAFQLLTVGKVIRFYNSIYHIGVILWVALYVTGIIMLQSRPRQSKDKDEKKKEE